MNKQTLKYLQEDAIGKVIAKGLADLYCDKPQTPVKYLIDWLKKYSQNQKQKANVLNQQQYKNSKVKQLNSQLLQKQKKNQYKKQMEKQTEKKLQSFKNKVQNHQYQQQLLKSQLPQFLFNKIKLTGCYIGYVNHPTKTITDQDQDVNAHLNTSIPKLINYIGYNHNHQNIMKNQTLPLDKGVTAAALALSLQDPIPNQDGTVQAKQKYVYVSNVVKNESVHYFRLPKLGAYIAVPLIYNSYLSQDIFDVALEKRLKYLQELLNYQKTKSQQLKQLDNQKQTLNIKLAELQAKGGQEQAIQQVNNDIRQIQQKKKQKQSQKFDQQKTQLPTQKRQFIVCGDTLGQDSQISLQDRNILVDIVKHFKDSWQNKQKQLLYKDVQYQIKIKKNIDQTAQGIMQNLQKISQIPTQKKTIIDQIQDQKLRQFRKSYQSLELFKNQMKNNQLYLASFFKLKNFRIVKYQELVQAILYFLRYKKQDINIAGKTIINWKKVRALYMFADTFFAILNFNCEGAKPQVCPNYSKLNHVLQILQGCSQNEIFQYNVGLGAIVRYVKKLIAHRIANIQLRRHQKQKQRERRLLLLEQNQKITEEKRVNLQKHKQALVGQQLQLFKEQEWSAKYDQQNPLKQIPPEVVQDIDNDF